MKLQRSTLIFLLILSVIAGLLGYHYFTRSSEYVVQNENEEWMIESSPTPIPDPIGKLSPAEQVRQLIAYPLFLTETESQNLEEDQIQNQLRWIDNNQPGMVVLFGDKISTTAAVLVEEKLTKIKVGEKFSPLLAVDHEGGRVQRLSGDGFSELPTWENLCQLNSEPRRESLTTSAEELAGVGVDIVLAPVVDLASASGSLGARTCDSDTETVISRAQEFIKIFKNRQILPVIKHFPGIGGVSVDLHYDFANAVLTPADLEVFQKILTDDESLGVMVTHVGVADRYPNQPCSLNQDCLSDLSEYFTEVLVISDALEMSSASQREELSAEAITESTTSATANDLDLSERAVLAVKAGNNLLTFGAQVTDQELDEVLFSLETEYNSNPEFAQRVKNSLEKIWYYQERFGN